MTADVLIGKGAGDRSEAEVLRGAMSQPDAFDGQCNITIAGMDDIYGS